MKIDTNSPFNRTQEQVAGNDRPHLSSQNLLPVRPKRDHFLFEAVPIDGLNEQEWEELQCPDPAKYIDFGEIWEELSRFLSPLEMKILEERHLNGRSLNEVGALCDCSESLAQHFESRAILKIRRNRRISSFIQGNEDRFLDNLIRPAVLLPTRNRAIRKPPQT